MKAARLILAPWAAIVALWYALHYSGLVNPALVPTPHAVAKRFVEQNGGRLEIHSTPGTGTTVRIRLPAEAAA